MADHSSDGQGTQRLIDSRPTMIHSYEGSSMTNMSDDEKKKAADDLTADWIEATAQLPKMGQTVQIRLAPQQEPPYDLLPSEVKAVFKPHWHYQTPQFSPEWRTPDGNRWCLYVCPSQITHWRYLGALSEEAPLRSPSPVLDSPPAIYTPKPAGTKRSYALTPEGRASKSEKMQEYWRKRWAEANGD